MKLLAHATHLAGALSSCISRPTMVLKSLFSTGPPTPHNPGEKCHLFHEALLDFASGSRPLPSTPAPVSTILLDVHSPYQLHTPSPAFKLFQPLKALKSALSAPGRCPGDTGQRTQEGRSLGLPGSNTEKLPLLALLASPVITHHLSTV